MKFLAFFDNLMEEDSCVVIELTLLISNIKKEVCVVLDSFLSVLKKYDKKLHNIFSLILNLRFKSLCLIFSFIEWE